MTDTFYPDVSNHNPGVNLTGSKLVMAKATEGTSYVDPTYLGVKRWCAFNHATIAAYHFLHAGKGAAQAVSCRSVVCDDVPIMVDVEPTGTSMPVLADVMAFVNEARLVGHKVHLVYLPHWYWQQIGSPNLGVLPKNGLHLVSSNYTTYSDTGLGWASYGGVAPSIWQYTDRQLLNGQLVDFNAFK